MSSNTRASKGKNVQGEGLIRKNSKRARQSSGNESRGPPRVAWSSMEKKALETFEQFTIHSTRFADKEILEKMGLLDDVSAFLDSVGIGILLRIDAPTLEHPVKHLLATVTVEYADNNDKKAQEGMLRFKVDDNEYALSIFDVCEAYGFAKTSDVQFPMLYATDLVWKTIADRSYESRSAKTTCVRNPVIRYVCKLLANTFYARHETGAVKTDEVCFVYQGIKGMLTNRNGNQIEDDLGDDVNYGSLLATRIMEVKNWAKLAKKKHIWLGGFLTPLLAKAGVDLTRYAPNEDRNYLDHPYLVKNRFLKGGTNNAEFLYKLNDASRKTRTFKLPNTARTTLLGLDNIKFNLQEEEFYDAIRHDEDAHQQPMGERSTSELYGLDAYDLPEIDFNPRTTREKLIHKAYTMQRKINQIQKKLFAKIFRKLKKVQPPNYVSSEEENEHDKDEEMGDETTESDEDLELRTKTRQDRPGTSQHL